MIEARAFRKLMGSFPTGVTVVSARGPAGEPRGLTVNSFASVSLDPPLVLVCIDRASASHDLILAAGSFTVSVLASDQQQLAGRFAVEPAHVRFEEVAWWVAPNGGPVVSGSASWLACTLREAHRGGDHTILVGLVEDGGTGEADALLFYRGSFGAVPSAKDGRSEA
jgi:flavin reductase (DIM6/NTAB) family NADH-FMN oxidoreductase RutF